MKSASHFTEEEVQTLRAGLYALENKIVGDRAREPKRIAAARKKLSKLKIEN